MIYVALLFSNGNEIKRCFTCTSMRLIEDRWVQIKVQFANCCTNYMWMGIARQKQTVVYVKVCLKERMFTRTICR